MRKAVALRGGALLRILVGVAAIAPLGHAAAGWDAAAKDKLFRRSCYCIWCQEGRDVKEVVGVGCKYIRWAAFPWIAYQPSGPEVDYAGRLNLEFDNLAAFVRDLRRQPGGEDVVVEFGIPEIVLEAIQTVEIAPEHLKRLGLPPGFRFQFAGVRCPKATPKLTDCFWQNCDFNGGHKNGVPSLQSEQGKAWHRYLALRAFEAGADAIYISQMNIRIPDLAIGEGAALIKSMVTSLRELKKAVTPGTPGLIVGGESVEDIANTGDPLADYIDYQKYVSDLDVYDRDKKVMDPRRGGQRGCHLGTPMPASDPAGKPTQQFLCLAMAGPNVRRMRFFEPDNPWVGPDFLNCNPHRIPVFLEYDGCQVCGATPPWLYPLYMPNHDGPLTTCYPQVRHGLTVTHLYFTRPANVRHAFLRYMYDVAERLSKSSPYGVYFPLPVKVDQNRLAIIRTPKVGGGFLYEEQAVRLQRYCPAGDDDPLGAGLLPDGQSGHPYEAFHSRQCKGDLEVMWQLLNSGAAPVARPAFTPPSSEAGQGAPPPADSPRARTPGR